MFKNFTTKFFLLYLRIFIKIHFYLIDYLMSNLKKIDLFLLMNFHLLKYSLAILMVDLKHVVLLLNYNHHHH